MEARLESDWMRDEWKVWMVDRSGPMGRRRVYGALERTEDGFSNDHRVESTVLDEGAAGPLVPSLILPTDWLSALVAAAQTEAGITPPDRAQGVHLADAIAMRDRLLTVVESDVLSYRRLAEREPVTLDAPIRGHVGHVEAGGDVRGDS